MTRLFPLKSQVIKRPSLKNPILAAVCVLVAPVKGHQRLRNILNSNNQTGEYLAAPTQGLFAGAFYGDPRMYGIAASVKF